MDREPILVREIVDCVGDDVMNPFSISNTGNYGPVKNRIAEALVNRILSAARDGRKFRVSKVRYARGC